MKARTKQFVVVAISIHRKKLAAVHRAMRAEATGGGGGRKRRNRSEWICDAIDLRLEQLAKEET